MSKIRIPRKDKKIFKVKLQVWNTSHTYTLPYCIENYQFLMHGKKKMIACVKLF